MAKRFDIGAHGAVILGGRDLTRHTKRFSSTENIVAIDDTHLQPEGDAMNFIAGMESAAISLSGSLPVSKALVEIEMKKALGLNRDPEPLLLAPWGMVPGYYAEFLQTEQTRFGTDGMTPNMTSYNVDFVGTGGLKRGTVLHSSQGAGTVTQNEIKTLTFSGISSNQFYGLRAIGTAEVFPFTTATTNPQFKAGVEALPAYAGRTLTVTGATLTGTADAKFGAKNFEFSGGSAAPDFEVVTGAVTRQLVQNGDADADYSFYGGAAFALGISQAAFQANQRAIGGAHAGVVCVGSSAVVAMGVTISGAGTPGYNGFYSKVTDYIYRLDATHWLYIPFEDKNYWVLAADTLNSNDANIAYRATNGSSETLPTTFTVFGSAGAAPAPTAAVTNNPASLDFISYFPVGVTPGAPTKTGTGATNTVLAEANTAGA